MWTDLSSEATEIAVEPAPDHGASNPEAGFSRQKV